MRRAALAVVALLCLTFVCVAQTLTFPALSGRVVDQAEILSPTDRLALTKSLADLEAKTTDQFVVVTLKSLQGTTIEDYGYQLGRRWGIGQREKDSGVLLIVAAKERKARIEVGYGLEGTLTDAATKVIIETAIVPRFKAGDLSGGIEAGARDVILALGGAVGAGGSTEAPVDGRTGSNLPIWLVIALGLVGVVMLVVCTMTKGGALCQAMTQLLLVMVLSGRGGSSRGNGSFSGGGGSFGGGGSSGSW